MRKIAFISGATVCLLAVLFGAFGAHALADIIAENNRQDVFALANRYQFYHGFGLLFVGILAGQIELSKSVVLIAVVTMLLGILFFSGSLYVLALTNVSWLGAITPVGGFLLLVAWSVLIKGVLTDKRI